MVDEPEPGPEPESGTVTRLLYAWRAGDPHALEALLPLVYDQLRRLAHRLLLHEGSGRTLQTTEVVHEAYLRLAGADISWADRAHFYRVAAGQMRRLLIDRARARRSAKRGGGAAPLPLDEALTVASEPSPDLLDLDAALARLARQDPRKAEVIELHLFAGLTQDEIAATLGISTATVERELRVARAWLGSEFAPGRSGKG